MSSADRVLVASLTGVAARFASGQQQRIHEQFGDDEPAGDEAAVAALHEVTADRELLTVAAAMYVDPDGRWYAGEALRLLVLAGADETAARQHRADNPPREFRFPQT